MKKIYLLLLFIVLAGFGFGQTTVKYQSFESGSDDWGYTPDPATYSVGDDVWAVVTSSFHTFTTIPSESTHFWGMEDLANSNGGTATGIWSTLTFASVDVSAYTDITISFDYEVDGYDDGDDIKYQAFFDGTGESEVLLVDGSSNLNQDGTVTISVTGGTDAVYLVVSIKQNGSDFGGLDNFKVRGTATGSVSNPTSFAFEYVTSTKTSLTWTAPSGTYDNVLVFGRDGAAVDHSPSGAGSGYSNMDAAWGSAGSYDNSKLLYSGTGTTVTITGLTEGNTYYFKAYAYDDSDWSSGTSDINDEVEVQGTSSFAASAGNEEVDLSWTNYTGAVTTWWDEVLVLAKSGSAVDGTPTGDGSAYTANAAFGSGTEVGTGNYVVYKGTGTSETVTSLTNGTTYHFRTFVRYGSDWTDSDEWESVDATPAEIPKIIISEVADPDDVYQARFIELYNLGTSVIDFDSEVWYLSRQINGGSTWEDKQLTGSIAPDATYISANNNDNTSDYFCVNFGFMADFNYGGSGGNGDDGYYLYKGGNHSLGTLIDAYGVINENGTGKPWGYENKKAIRKTFVTSPNTTWTASEWTITAADVADCDPGTYNDFMTWVGSGTTDWGTASNWMGGVAPTSSNGIKIPSGVSNYPLVSGNATTPSECNNLTIASGASLTIPEGKALTVSGSISNNAGISGLVIKLGSVNDGSLIYTSGTPIATIEKYVSKNSWNMVTIPVDETTAQTFADATPASDSWLTKLNEPTATNNTAAGTGWIYITDLDTILNYGTGFAYWPSASEIIEFEGNLRSSDLDVSNLSAPFIWTDSDHGYNLLGNPFSSALQWNDHADWSLTTVDGTIWIFNNANNNYSSFTQANDHNIAVGQGFIVRSSASGPALTFPASQRQHSNNTFLKNGETEGIGDYENVLTIDVLSNNFMDKVQISFQENGTQGYDNGWDGIKMFGPTESPQLYLREGERNQSHDHLPLLNEGEERTLAMSYIPGAAGEQKLIANFTYFTGADVTLEDLKTGNTQNLNENYVYSFTASKDDSPERFLLHFIYSPDGIDEDIEQESNISIYSYGKEVYIRSSEEAINQNGNVFVYDFLGREILQQELETGKLQKIHINANNSYLIVKVVKDGSSKTQKLYIK